MANGDYRIKITAENTAKLGALVVDGDIALDENGDIQRLENVSIQKVEIVDQDPDRFVAAMAKGFATVQVPPKHAKTWLTLATPDERNAQRVKMQGVLNRQRIRLYGARVDDRLLMAMLSEAAGQCTCSIEQIEVTGASVSAIGAMSRTILGVMCPCSGQREVQHRQAGVEERIDVRPGSDLSINAAVNASYGLDRRDAPRPGTAAHLHVVANEIDGVLRTEIRDGDKPGSVIVIAEVAKGCHAGDMRQRIADALDEVRPAGCVFHVRAFVTSEVNEGFRWVDITPPWWNGDTYVHMSVVAERIAEMRPQPKIESLIVQRSVLIAHLPDRMSNEMIASIRAAVRGNGLRPAGRLDRREASIAAQALEAAQQMAQRARDQVDKLSTELRQARAERDDAIRTLEGRPARHPCDAAVADWIGAMTNGAHGHRSPDAVAELAGARAFLAGYLASVGSENLGPSMYDADLRIDTAPSEAQQLAAAIATLAADERAARIESRRVEGKVLLLDRDEDGDGERLFQYDWSAEVRRRLGEREAAAAVRVYVEPDDSRVTPGSVILAGGLLVAVQVVGWGARALGAPRRDLLLWYELGAGAALVALFAGPWFVAGSFAIAGVALALDAHDRRRR